MAVLLQILVYLIAMSDIAISKYEHLKNSLIHQIQSDQYSPGDQIPPQLALAEKFNVSRITVRRATADLIAAGVIEHRPGRRGLFVAKREDPESGARTIAVAIDDVADRFGSTILRGIEDFLWEQRYHTIICNADRNFEKVEQYFHSFDYEKIEGVIFAPVIDVGFQERNRQITALLKDKSMPFVIVDRKIDRVAASSVTTNHRESARRLTQALINAGNERVLLGRGIECTSVAEREAGYRQAYHDAGLELDEDLILQVNDNSLLPNPDPNEIVSMEEQIRQAGAFTAFYALNNRILRAGIQSMQSLEIDTSMIQFALHNEVSRPIPPFTDHIPRIIPPLYRMGWLAARTLLDIIAGAGHMVSEIVLESEVKYENLTVDEGSLATTP